ncbi:MAG: iron-containing alcohol dehydrogenase [Pseudomonadota bacterium]
MKNILSDLLCPHPNPLPRGEGIEIIVEKSLKDKSAELLRLVWFDGKESLIVCDNATYQALAARIAKEIAAKVLVLDSPKADIKIVEQIRGHKYDALIGVGSGTISDLCKYAAFLDDKDYAVFPTAASMNGYVSANASISVAGYKQTLPAKLPKGVFCDLQVLADAPLRLTLSGLGDSLCRPTAQADWLLSHLLLDSKYNAAVFAMSEQYEKELFEYSTKLSGRDLQVIELLIKTLLASGLAMTIAGGSYPASQGEHMIAHTMEMQHNLQGTYHGEEIGVTTLIMANIQENMLKNRLKLPLPVNCDEKIEAYFKPSLHAQVKAGFAPKKQILEEKYQIINERLISEDSVIRDAISQFILPEKYLRKVLQNAQAPSEAAQIGWNQGDLQAATLHAKYIRNRFTCLDFL